MALLLHGLKSPRIFNENKRFLSKVIFIPQHSSLRGRHGIAIFQHFDALSVIRNVQAFEIRLGFRDDFLIRCESLSLEPLLEVWEDNSRWGPSLENTVREQSIRIVIGPIWPSLSRTCVIVMVQNEGESSTT